MKLRILQTIALLLWGYQANLVMFAIPMALIWEARFFINRRWELTQKDFYLLADLTSVCLVLLLVFLYINRTEYHFLTALIQWLPILFYPLVIVLGYSTKERMSLDVLFYSLRRQKQPVTQSWDMDYLLFGALIVASGMNRDLPFLYFPAVTFLIIAALFQLRTKRYAANLWVLLICGVILSAFLTQAGIRESHLELKKRAQVWLANWIQQRTNPLRTQTAMGQVGRLKTSDEIIFRVRAEKGATTPGLLEEASYDLPLGNSWTVMEPNFSEVEHTDDFIWDIAPVSTSDSTLDIYLEFTRERAVIPLPASTTRIDNLPALEIKQNYYGAVQALNLVPSPGYKIQYSNSATIYGPPKPTDIHIPNEFAETIRLAAGDQLDAAHPISSLRHYFRDFRYSLYQQSDFKDKPLKSFLLTTKAGHCEYFASATVLLLRYMGIPARYVVGYALQEYNESMGMTIVRQRHAHAWAIAYINGQWQAVDSTPSIWLATETAQSTFLRPVLDFFSNQFFMLRLWWNAQKMADYERYMYGLGVLLLIILLWRIFTSEQVLLKPEDKHLEIDSPLHQGWNSPVFKLAEAISLEGYDKQPGEGLRQWWTRTGFTQFIPLLEIHNRLRFDPSGIAPAEQLQLEQSVELALESFKKPVT